MHFAFRCVCGTVTRVGLEATFCPQCNRPIQAAQYGDTMTSCSIVEPEELFPADDFIGSGLESRNLPAEEFAGPSLSDTVIGSPDLTGRKLGHFLIETKLGQGGMGEVYRALDESLQRYVALKVIRTDREAQATARHAKLLKEEARAQARVHHPHVVQIFYVGEQDGFPFLAMELVTGETLQKRLEHGPLSYEEIVQIAEQVTAALGEAARFDLVHGDIKPGNLLLVNGSGNLKLSDFGLAFLTSTPGTRSGGSAPVSATESPSRVSSHSGDRSLAGTPAYLPPEAWQGQSVDIQGDMYALGIVLYEMTFGVLPFQTDRLGALMKAHLHESLKFPAQAERRVPENWLRLLERLTAKKPGDRFGSYEDLAHALRRVRPVTKRAAGLVNRALAWGLDLSATTIATFCILFLVVGLSALVLESTSSSYTLEHHSSLLDLLLGWSTIGGVVLAGIIQMAWGNTPGKHLMQLHAVDSHGLAPCGAVLWARNFAQFGPLLLVGGWLVSQAAQFLTLATPLLALGVGLVLVDAGLALFPGRRTLHDRVFGTRVVLDG